jgi:predicted  nucleic acid-binding Zn-ribbon protein
MEPTDITIDLLRSIRDEIQSLGRRQDETNNRLDRVVQEQIRQATAIIELQHAVVDLHKGQTELTRGQGVIVEELRKLNDRIDHVLTGPLGGLVRDHEQRISSVERRLATVEERLEP